MQKINFIAHYFLEKLWRYCMVVILSTLGMPGCTHQTWQYQIFEYFEVYLCKNQLYLLLIKYFIIYHGEWKYSISYFLLYIYHGEWKYSISYFFLKIPQRFCKLVISSTLGKTIHTHQYWYINLQKGLYICMQKINFMRPFFLILIGIHSMQV